MKPIRIRPLAVTDIDHAVAYLWEDNPMAATQLLDALEEGFKCPFPPTGNGITAVCTFDSWSHVKDVENRKISIFDFLPGT